jgi:hypothetical protein
MIQYSSLDTAWGNTYKKNTTLSSISSTDNADPIYKLNKPSTNTFSLISNLVNTKTVTTEPSIDEQFTPEQSTSSPITTKQFTSKQSTNSLSSKDQIKLLDSECDIFIHMTKCKKCKERMKKMLFEDYNNTININLNGMKFNINKNILMFLFILILCIIFLIIVSMFTNSSNPFNDSNKYLYMLQNHMLQNRMNLIN